MARVIDTFPAATSQSRYPWDEWLDGRVWELIAGEDFSSKPETIRQNATVQAHRRGGTARTRLIQDGERQVVVLQMQSN
jgi:hypothetical protein